MGQHHGASVGTSQVHQDPWFTKATGFLLYQMMSVSQLQFVEFTSARIVIGGPGLWASMHLFEDIQTHCHFPVAVKAFDTSFTSALLKTGLSLQESWQQGIKVITKDDDAQFTHPNKQWLQGCGVYKLREVCTSTKQCDLDMIMNLKTTMKKEKNVN